MNKHGQAFLITAVIIIIIIIALATISNSFKKPKFSTFPYVAEEIQIESEKVMDYSLLKNDVDAKDKFIGNISNYMDKDTRIYFIINESGTIRFKNSTKDLPNPLIENRHIIATIDNTNYTFPVLKQGKSFYFIMIKDYKGEKYVYTNA